MSRITKVHRVETPEEPNLIISHFYKQRDAHVKPL